MPGLKLYTSNRLEALAVRVEFADPAKIEAQTELQP